MPQLILRFAGAGRRSVTRDRREIGACYDLESLEPRVLFSGAVASLTDMGEWPMVRSVPDGIVIATTLWDESGVCLTKLTEQGAGDSSFGTDGVVMLNGAGPVCQMTVQPDGKVLVLTAGPLDGFERLFRLNSDGGLDSTFGKAGQITLSDAFADWVRPTGDIVVTADGKIAVVAQADDPDGEHVDLTFYRFSATGQADETFGDHGETRIVTPDYYWWIGDAQIGADGTLSACGNSWDSSAYIVQLDALGKPSSGFGQGGVLIQSRVGGEDVTLWSDSTLLITNYSSPGLTLRLTDLDGQPVAGFGDNGTATVFDTGGDERLLYGAFGLSDGTIVLVEGSRWAVSSSIVLLNSDGSLDATFGGGAGYVDLPKPRGDFDYGGEWDLDVDAQGRVVYLSPAVTGTDGEPHFEVTRLAPDGSLDVTFGDGGVSLLRAGKIVGPPLPPSPPSPSSPAETPEPETDDSVINEEDAIAGEGDAPDDPAGDETTAAVLSPSLPTLLELPRERSPGLFNSDRPILGTESDDLFGE